MERNEKWNLFKQFMHNEIGVSKEDIREWIQEAVREQAERLVSCEFNKFDINKTIESIVMNNKYFGSQSLKEEIKKELINKIYEKVSLILK